MSTLEECLRSRRLIPLLGWLENWETAQRCLYVHPRAIEWMKHELPRLKTDNYWQGSPSPSVQAKVWIHDFVAGKPPIEPLPHEMRPQAAGIWEMRTFDLRFFGWFPQSGTFIISSVQSKINCFNKALYDGYRKQAVTDRTQLNLFGGKFAEGLLNDLL